MWGEVTADRDHDREHTNLGESVDDEVAIDGGNPINRNKLIALLAAIILRDHPGTAVAGWLQALNPKP